MVEQVLSAGKESLGGRGAVRNHRSHRLRRGRVARSLAAQVFASGWWYGTVRPLPTSTPRWLSSPTTATSPPSGRPWRASTPCSWSPAGSTPRGFASTSLQSMPRRPPGSGRIVYLSFLGASADATFTLARQHFATEEHIRATGIPFTFLSSGLYLDYMPFVASAGVIAGPAGDGRFAPVARDDIADTVFTVLTTREHDGKTYDNTGPTRSRLPRWRRSSPGSPAGRSSTSRPDDRRGVGVPPAFRRSRLGDRGVDQLLPGDRQGRVGRGH